MQVTQQFDYIIVGGGSAGSVLANRLSANPATRVCLLEAGPHGDTLTVRMPAGIIALMRSNRRNWRYYTAPQEALDNRQLYIPRGKTLGGSSAVNAMIYTRGHPSDYDHWAGLGNTGWAWDDVLPVFRRSEHQERGGDAYHGTGGPLNVADLRYRHAVSEAFVAAGVQAGHAENEDFNGPEQAGVGLYQVTQKDGERWGVARGYLQPVMQRENLTVITGARVQRVLLDGKRAIGVVYRQGRREHRIEAGETILCGGAINSPQLLLLSGIGPKAELQKHDIAVRHELSGVGENLQDHPDVLVVHRTPVRDTFSLSPLSLPNMSRALWDWFRRGEGRLTSNVAEAGGFIKSRPEASVPDLQLHLTAAMLDNHGLNWWFATGWGYSGHVCILRPQSRGRVGLYSADPQADAMIDPRFLTAPGDMEDMVRGVRALRGILRQPALDAWRGPEVFPEADIQTDEEYRAFIRQKCDNIYHPVGTCKMGVDDRAVVHPQGLGVHGLDGLRVVDASVMPTLIGGNTNAPTVMIAEKAADQILGAESEVTAAG